MKHVFAVANEVREDCRKYVTPGKEYALEYEDDTGALFIAEDGEKHYLLWKCCAYIGNNDWRRIERESSGLVVSDDLAQWFAANCHEAGCIGPDEQVVTLKQVAARESAVIAQLIEALEATKPLMDEVTTIMGSEYGDVYTGFAESVCEFESERDAALLLAKGAAK